MRRPPHFFLHGNLVFGADAEDAWAAYRLEGRSYPGLSARRKLELKAQLDGLAYALEADFQLLRVASEFSADAYVDRALASLRGDRHRGAFTDLLSEHRAALERRRVVRPAIYLFVRLGPPLRGASASERLAEIRRSIWSALGANDARRLRASQLAELRRREERVFDRVFGFLACDRVRATETAALISRAYQRGLRPSAIDSNWRPQALWVERDPGAGDEESGAEPAFEPYELDLLRLHNAYVEVGARALGIESEAGLSHQALLVMGALPELSRFPGDAELLFSPLELGFGVDAIVSCEYLPNERAQALARKRKVDADQQAREESYGEHGPSVQSAERPYAARELEQRLAGTDRPPLLRSAIALAVGAPDAETLEERVEQLRQAYGRVQLHRPFGEQHRLFLASMPAMRFPLPDYKQHILPEQLGAMMPVAVSHGGTEFGPYLGYTLTGSRQPVQFDLAEACAQNRPSAVYLAGSLGSGKTMCLQTMLAHAFWQGSAPIVDVDPKGDHRLERVPGMAEAMEVIELGPDPRYAGLLDPMRIGAEETREELAYTFLVSILPPPVPAAWQTELRSAIGEVASRGGQSCGEVIEALEGAGDAARDVARALSIHLSGGLAALGLAHASQAIPDPEGAEVVSLRIRNLTLPAPGTARAEFQEDERIGQAILRLVAAYAMRLCTSTRRHSVLALDEGWALVGDSVGRALLSRLSRMGRSLNITPIIASQIVGDAEELEPLVGALFAFGVETEAEARRALELLRLDSDDEGMVAHQLGFRAGRCQMRDFEGGTLPIRIDPGERLLAAFDTTPGAEIEPAADLREGVAERDGKPAPVG